MLMIGLAVFAFLGLTIATETPTGLRAALSAGIGIGAVYFWVNKKAKKRMSMLDFPRKTIVAGERPHITAQRVNLPEMRASEPLPRIKKRNMAKTRPEKMTIPDGTAMKILP